MGRPARGAPHLRPPLLDSALVLGRSAALVAAAGAALIALATPVAALPTSTTTSTTAKAKANTTTTTKATTSTTARATTTTEPATTTTTAATTTSAASTTTAAATTTVEPTTATEPATTTTTTTTAEPPTSTVPAPADAAPAVGAEVAPAAGSPTDPVAVLAQFTFVAFEPWRAALEADADAGRLAVLAPGYRFARDALADAVAARAGRSPATAVALSAAWERTEPKRMAVVLTALMQVGDPYVFAASGPDRFDCSGLTAYAWRTAGVDLVHYAVTQRQQSLDVAPDALAPGDLLFRFRQPGGHVMLYLGVDDLVVQAGGTATGVIVSPWGSIDAAGSPLAAPVQREPAGPAQAPTSLFGLAAAADPVGADTPFADAFNVAGARYGVAPSLLAAIAATGSGFRADPATVTTTGRGVMQLRPAVAAALGIDPNVPEQAIDAAARRLAALWAAIHDERAVVALYPTALQTVSSASVAPTDAATTAFVDRVLVTS